MHATTMHSYERNLDTRNEGKMYRRWSRFYCLRLLQHSNGFCNTGPSYTSSVGTANSDEAEAPSYNDVLAWRIVSFDFCTTYDVLTADSNGIGSVCIISLYRQTVLSNIDRYDPSCKSLNISFLSDDEADLYS